MTSQMAVVFSLGAWLFLVAAVVFSVASCWWPQRQKIFVSAAIVACVTSAVNFAQAVGLGSYTRPGDGASIFWLEWAGYSVSLYFIGSSLTLYLNPWRGADVALALHLAVVGLGGLAGLLIDSQHRAVQWAFVALTTLVYGLWIFLAALRIPGPKRNPRGNGPAVALYARGTVLAYFVAATLLYIVGYVAGAPVYGAIDATAEHAIYLAGNVLTKLLLPCIEAYWLAAVE